jgi:hypothetical protein
VQKGSSLLRPLAALDLPPTRPLVAGDTLNDLSMFDIGLGRVAVRTAKPRSTPPSPATPTPISARCRAQPGCSMPCENLINRRASIASSLVLVYHRQPYEEHVIACVSRLPGGDRSS